MLRFEAVENLGVTIAAFSDRSDGDCGWNAPEPGPRKAFLAKCGAGWSDLVCARQVHGNTVLTVDATHAGRGAVSAENAAGDADGLVTAALDVPLGVTCADCVPIFLYDPERGVGGVVHAGRLGTMNDIAGTAVQRLQAEFHVNPKYLHALVGPSAGPCCYEVSAEIARACEAACLLARGRMLDLWESNRLQLMTAGVPLENITVSGRCTICDPEFYSYRREGTAARQLALFML